MNSNQRSEDYYRLRYLELRTLVESGDEDELRNWRALRVLADGHDVDTRPWMARVADVLVPAGSSHVACIFNQQFVALHGVHVTHADRLLGTLIFGNEFYARQVPMTELRRLPTFVLAHPGTQFSLELFSCVGEPLATHVDFLGYELQRY